MERIPNGGVNINIWNGSTNIKGKGNGNGKDKDKSNGNGNGNLTSSSSSGDIREDSILSTTPGGRSNPPF
jgi:hypothetical protein